MNSELDKLTLGKTTTYPSSYDPSLLQAVSRNLNRDSLGAKAVSRMEGIDFWYGFEVFWQYKGSLKHSNIKVAVPADSGSIVESKSFKLYLYSFRKTEFRSSEEVLVTIIKDLSNLLGAKVHVEKLLLDDVNAHWKLPGILLEEDSYQDEFVHEEVDASLLQVVSTTHGSFEYTTNLLKSNCLITGQPDWGSLYISYKGLPVSEASLLKYIGSYRKHQGFHEHCVEQIFCDLLNVTQASSLTVYAQYTRRGSLAIAPLRSTNANNFDFPLLFRT